MNSFCTFAFSCVCFICFVWSVMFCIVLKHNYKIMLESKEKQQGQKMWLHKYKSEKHPFHPMQGMRPWWRESAHFFE